MIIYLERSAFSALTLLVGRQEGHPVCEKTEWWGAGVVSCLQRGADLHMAQLMPLLLTVCCFSKIQIGSTFVVPAHPGSPGQRAVKLVCVCVYLYLEREPDCLHIGWLMPHSSQNPIISCLVDIQNGFIFLYWLTQAIKQVFLFVVSWSEVEKNRRGYSPLY